MMSNLPQIAKYFEQSVSHEAHSPKTELKQALFQWDAKISPI